MNGYKNLVDFKMDFVGSNDIDIFVGKNGTGKSSLFEAILAIFSHLSEYDRTQAQSSFDYFIRYEIDGADIEVAWTDGILYINDRERKGVGKTLLPDNVLIYYSGHNQAVGELVTKYEERFFSRIKRADYYEARRFIGIGGEYKAILLAVLLIQPATSSARKFIVKRLRIESLHSELRLVLKRPRYANASRFDIDDPVADRYWKPEGITKTFLDRLGLCASVAGDGAVRDEGYFPTDDRYILYYDIAKIRQEFQDFCPADFFRQFDNLKTLGMLQEISIPLRLEGGADATIGHFSDGQFQSVYIYSVVEIFKDRNCLTLLDEPDAFLHPEWQFEFLRQVSEINSTTGLRNHMLMSSHSASTITQIDERSVGLLMVDAQSATVRPVNKSDVIRTLSAGLITFTESEARLNINHILRNTDRAVLFAEGVTDEIILEAAWSKVYPGETMNFDIQSAFGRVFLRNLFSRKELQKDFPGRTLIALFDFDEAYDDWNGLQAGADLVTDPECGLAKQLVYKHHYAMLLPVPTNSLLRRQVLDEDGKPWGRGVDSHLSIELLFFEESLLGSWYQKRPASGGGEIIEFAGDKLRFAKEFVPQLDETCFEVFRPMFEFIRTKCA